LHIRGDSVYTKNCSGKKTLTGVALKKLNPDEKRVLQEVPLELQDKSLVCYDCGTTYVFSVAEQQEFQAKGHNHPPKRCPACRAKRAARRPERPVERERISNPGFAPANRQMFTVICSECGKETQVPFEPRAGRPVYCSDCYRKSRTAK